VGSSSQVTRIVDPFGCRTTLTYAASAVRQMTDVHGRITTLTIDNANRLVAVTRPELTVEELIYNSAYNETEKLIAYVSPDGLRTSFTYDTDILWRNGITSPDGATWSYHYAIWISTLVTDPQGQVTAIEHDAERNSLSVTNPLDSPQCYQYRNGLLTGYTDSADEACSCLGHSQLSWVFAMETQSVTPTSC
jgi:YD repeat-containing protein